MEENKDNSFDNINGINENDNNPQNENITTGNKPTEQLEGYKNLYAENYKFDKVYIPEPENVGKKHKKGRGLNVAIISLIIIFSLALGSIIGFGGAMLTYERMLNGEIPETTSAPVVVNNGGSQLSMGYLAEDIMNRTLTVAQTAALVKDSVVEIRTVNSDNKTSGAGSGVIIDGNGYIVTNNHVIDGAKTITVKLTNGKSYQATLIGTDEASDIALLSIKADEKLTVATVGDSKKIILGETVIAVGNPLGEFGGTVTDGIISALERHMIIEDVEMTLIQTNAAVSPGNSGGGLFNMAGELIGIVNAKSVGEYAEGLAFAIPVNKANEVIKELDEYGYVKGQVDTDLGLSLDEYTDYGVVVVGKNNGEFKKNDIVVDVEGVHISSTSNIKSVLKDKKVGDKVKVTVSRGNRQKLYTFTVTLKEYIPSTIVSE